MKPALIFLSALVLVASCGAPAVDTAAEGEKLMALSREWSRSAATDSIEKTLSYWADDAVVMEPGQPALKGKKAIREMIEGSAHIPGFRISWEPLSVSVSKSGDMAYMLEHTQVTVNDSLGNPIAMHNKAVTIWKKGADGAWKNVVDTWNADPGPGK